MVSISFLGSDIQATRGSLSSYLYVEKTTKGVPFAISRTLGHLIYYGHGAKKLDDFQKRLTVAKLLPIMDDTISSCNTTQRTIKTAWTKTAIYLHDLVEALCVDEHMKIQQRDAAMILKQHQYISTRRFQIVYLYRLEWYTASNLHNTSIIEETATGVLLVKSYNDLPCIVRRLAMDGTPQERIESEPVTFNIKLAGYQPSLLFLSLLCLPFSGSLYTIYRLCLLVVTLFKNQLLLLLPRII